MTIYTYNENVTRAGEVALVEDGNGDMTAHEGTGEELVSLARETMREKATAQNAFARKTARSILSYLDAEWVSQEEIRDLLLEELDSFHAKEIKEGVAIVVEANAVLYGVTTDGLSVEKVVQAIHLYTLFELSTYDS